MALYSRIRSELDILAAVERGEVVTQMDLKHRIGVSIGLINALLRRAIQKGHIKARQVPYKRYAYYVTPKGFSEKSRLVAEYLARSLQFYRLARREYAELIAEARNSGINRLVLIGGGELAEIAVLAAWGENVTLQAIVDPGTNESQRCGVRVIRSIDEVEVPDAVVITNARAPQRAYEEMLAVLPASRILAPPLLKITRDRAELLAALDLSERAS
jgi:DNA-binding MarR family transcriptional regulator